MPHQCPQKDLIACSFFLCVCISFAHSYTPGSELIDPSLDEPASEQQQQQQGCWGGRGDRVRSTSACSGTLEWGHSQQ